MIGDHNDLQVDATRPNGVLVTENRGKGIRFTRVRIVIGPGKEGVVYKTADFHKPWTIGVTPDAAIQAKIDELNAQLAPILGTEIGESTQGDPARRPVRRAATAGLCESLVGNVVTDAMRAAYADIGVQFAITNSGGLRADLTCPVGGSARATSARVVHAAAVPDHARPVARRASVREHRRDAGRERRRAEDDARERRLAACRRSTGRFPQVSGLCFTYDIAAAAGSRVTGAVMADAAGNCTATRST